VVGFTGRVAVQWARESSDGRRMVWAVEAGLVKAAKALCDGGGWGELL
jgi:hypothetical protein